MIYVTPYDKQTKQCTGPSAPSGFDTLADVLAVLPDPIRASNRLALYEDVAFSDYIMALDKPAGGGYIDTKSNKGGLKCY